MVRHAATGDLTSLLKPCRNPLRGNSLQFDWESPDSPPVLGEAAPVSDQKESSLLEAGQTVRWRGRRWRVTREEDRGFVELVGIEPTNRDQVVTPLLALEGHALQPDVPPQPKLDV